MTIEYSVEESPLGTAGSVRLASGALDETFLVISGDALCDIDLGSLVELPPREGRRGHDRAQVGRQPARVRHRRHRRGRPGRALPREAVLGPGLLRHDQHRHLRARAGGAAAHPDRPAVRLLEGALPAPARDGPADLRPRARRLLAGHRQPRPVPAGELRRARRARPARRSPGIRLRGNVWIGEGVEIDDVEQIEGPAFVGNYCRIARDASVGPYSVLSASVTLRERARTDALRDRQRDPHRPQRARRGRDRRAAPATSATTSGSTRASRSATRSRSARSRRHAGRPRSTRTRRSSPARRSTRA